MSKKSLVDSIEIKSPCSESWDAMNGNAKMRFCSHCDKHVNNLSELTRKQAMRLVRDSNGRLCVRYVKNPVNNQPVFAERLHQITRRAGIAAGVLGASLTLSTLAYAQGEPILVKNDEAVQTEVLNEKDTNKTENTAATISGTITDVNSAVILGAKITLTNGETKIFRTTVTNDEGFYEFKDVEAGIYDLNFESNGFEAKQISQIMLAEAENRNQDVSLDVLAMINTIPVNERMMVMGDVAFVEYRNPLHLAVSNDDFEEVQNLIIKGANVNQKDENYNNITPLFLAVENGNVELAEYLLRFGAKVNARDDNKQTPLMRLDSDASAELVNLLIKYGAKVNLTDKDGNTPLILAANSVNAEVLQVLLVGGAEPNAQNKEGQTALMNAADADNLENVRALLLAGADVNLKNKNGETAWDLTGGGEIDRLLESYGAITEDN